MTLVLKMLCWIWKVSLFLKKSMAVSVGQVVTDCSCVSVPLNVYRRERKG